MRGEHLGGLDEDLFGLPEQRLGLVDRRLDPALDVLILGLIPDLPSQMDLEEILARGDRPLRGLVLRDLVVSLPDEVEGRAANGEEDDPKQDGQGGQRATLTALGSTLHAPPALEGRFGRRSCARS